MSVPKTALSRTAAAFPLLPETGVNLQAGWRTRPVRSVTLESAVFHNLIANTVVQMPFSIDEQHVILNSEDSRASGVDVSARLDSAAWTSTRYNVFTSVVHSLTHARFRGGQLHRRTVPDVPTHAGSLTAGVDHARGWHVSATAAWVGRFMTDLANTRAYTLAGEDGGFIPPGMPFSLRETVVLGEVPTRVLAARASMVVPGTRVVLWLHGRNLTDRLYVTDLTNGLRPGAGRTVTAGARVQF